MSNDPWPYLAPPAPEVRLPQPASTMAVIVTAHNVAAHLPAALACVFSQTRSADEVIVCDDGSHDDIDVAIGPYRDQIKVVRRTHGGEGAAKNSAVAASTSDVVVILDGDDEMTPRRLEALEWLATRRPDLDIITTEFAEFGCGASAERWSLASRFPVEDQRAAILAWNFLPAPAIRREPLISAGGFDEGLPYAPDWECYVRMVLRGSRAGLITVPLYRYRRWAGQQSADRRRVLEGRIQVLEKVAALPLLDFNDMALVERSITAAILDRWRYELRNGRPASAEARQLALSPLLPARSRMLAALGAVAPAAARAIDRRRHPT